MSSNSNKPTHRRFSSSNGSSDEDVDGDPKIQSKKDEKKEKMRKSEDSVSKGPRVENKGRDREKEERRDKEKEERREKEKEERREKEKEERRDKEKEERRDKEKEERRDRDKRSERKRSRDDYEASNSNRESKRDNYREKERKLESVKDRDRPREEKSGDREDRRRDRGNDRTDRRAQFDKNGPNPRNDRSHWRENRYERRGRRHGREDEEPSGDRPVWATKAVVRRAEEIQQRKMLWSKPEAKDGESAESETPKPIGGRPSTSSTWNSIIAASSSDTRQLDKFKKLMGMKKSDEPESSSSSEVSKEQVEAERQRQSALFNTLDRQYAMARSTTHLGRGQGLGFH